jgi:PAS domain-containing protein
MEEKDKNNAGIVYVLTNESMPDYIKIGKTSTSLEQRIKELSSSTSIPLPFTCFYACTVKDAQFVEHQLHDAFGDNRVNPKREFFQISPQRVVSALKLVEIEDITPKKDIVEDQEDQEALNEARKKRPPFRFKMVNIPPGAEIIFSRDHNIKAKVLDDRFIELDGKRTRLSNSAQEILGYDYGVAGTDYWMYDGETLDERRRRIEAEQLADDMALDAAVDYPEGKEPTEEEIDSAGDRWIQSRIDIERGK